MVKQKRVVPLISDKLGFEIVSKAANVLEGLGIQYWFATGTALGVARAGKPMQFDVDIDVEIWHRDYHRITDILEGFKAQGFNFKSFHSYRGRIEQIGWLYKGLLFDITFKHLDGANAWCTSKDVQKDGSIKWVDKAYPREWFEDLEYIKAYDVLDIPVPNPVEDYLAWNYGDDWQTPQEDYWEKHGYYADRNCITTINKDIA